MDRSPEKYVGRLLELSQKKRQLLQEMLELTHRQSGVLDQNTVDVLEKLVDEKQERINSIDKLDEEFNVYFLRLKQELKSDSLEGMTGLKIPGMKELQQNVRTIMGLIKEISDVEGQNNQKAKDLLNIIGNEIKKLNLGKKINSAYVPRPTQAPSYFIDKKK